VDNIHNKNTTQRTKKEVPSSREGWSVLVSYMPPDVLLIFKVKSDKNFVDDRGMTIT
jgi:hypothetical protein